MQLLEALNGKWVRVLRVEGDRALKNRLAQHGLYPGDLVRVLRTAPLDGPLLVEANGREIAIGRSVAENIFIEDIE
jgi:ferrous iron transport protein A